MKEKQMKRVELEQSIQKSQQNIQKYSTEYEQLEAELKQLESSESTVDTDPIGYAIQLWLFLN